MPTMPTMRAMRRKERQLPFENAMELLRTGQWGILSTVGPEGEPYGVPLTYALDGVQAATPSEEHDAAAGNAPCGFVIFHAATAGRKLENLAAEKRCSFTVVGATKVLPERFSVAYKSVMVFGEMEQVDKPEEKERLLTLLIDKYASDFYEQGQAYVNRSAAATQVLRLRITGLSGKGRCD